jgi:RNA polymerase sigma factor (sigma-70 family)
MDEHDWLAERFEENRPHLRAVAYRVLGSASEADDAVQEAWLRFSRAGAGEVENLGGWLTTIVARVSLNMLHSRLSRREEPMDPPAMEAAEDGINPEHEAVLADSVGLALLVVLDTLTPAERLAFVLHDMFAMPFDEIAPIVERSPAAARQLASRARQRDNSGRKRSWPQSSPPAVASGAVLAAGRGRSQPGRFAARPQYPVQPAASATTGTPTRRRGPSRETATGAPRTCRTPALRPEPAGSCATARRSGTCARRTPRFRRR